MALSKPVQPIELNKEQAKVVKAFKSGKNVLLTGPAGTGKSATLQEIVSIGKQKDLVFGITATTGAAAVLIGGRTLHSFLGIGLATKPPEVLAEWLRQKFPSKAKLLRMLAFLIIDEVSMLSDELFQYISAFLKALRHNQDPFGGVQLVLSGDFAQLRPVRGDFAFKSEEWIKCDFKVVVLREVYRQNGDTKFAEILMRLRDGSCSRDDFAELKKRVGANAPSGVLPTRLYSLNADVDRINNDAFGRLLKTEVAQAYPMKLPRENKAEAAKWAASCGIPEKVVMCKNAQVVVTWNIDPDNGILNGTRGRVVNIEPAHVVLELLDGRLVDVGYHEIAPEDKKKASIKFMPLKLAYALSIHKSQGMTLDCVEIDLGESIFEYGQAYVALSRARSLESVSFTRLSKRAFRTHPDVLRFYAVAREE